VIPLLLFAAGLAATTPPASASAPEPGVIKPPENLVVVGAPPIPADLVAAVQPYTEYRGAAFLSFHPERREMLIGTRFADTAQIHRVVAAGGARTQLTFFPDRVSGAAYPRAPLGAHPFFVFSKDTGGSEFWQIYRFDLETSAVTLLTDGRSRNTMGAFSHHGHRLAYTSTRRTGADNDIYVVDPADPKSDRRIAEVKGGGWEVVDWSPSDDRLLVSEEISINVSYYWSFDVATGQRTALTPGRDGGDKVSYRSARWAADGRALFLATDRDSELFRLSRLDLATGKHTYFSDHIHWDVEAVNLSDDGRNLAVVVNENGVGRVHLFDARSGKEGRAPALPPGSVSGVAWHHDGRTLAVTMTSARMAADVFVADTRSGHVERWTESELGGVDLRDQPEPQLVSWKAFDGRDLSGLLYRPPARFAGRRPVMINIHGGPEGQARPGFPGRSNYILRELGVAILYPNVRGSTGYGKTFTKLDNGVLREDSVKDIGALLDWLASNPDLDASRVMVIGGSYGGYMSLAVSARYADRICCSVDVVGISSFVTFLEHTEAYRRDLRRVEYGDERVPAMREFLERISPLHNSEKIVAPLFVAQGKNDPRVPLTEAEQIVKKVRGEGRDVWYMLAADEGHGFQKRSNRDALLTAITQFYKKNLLDRPSEPPTPG
jgi:dipeptidyl aminopeptidase/acylaminoacyl peptidase